MSRQRVAVVGAGISGVATAVNIQSLCPKAEVTLISDKFSPDTTGDGASGVIIPYLTPGTPVKDVQRWCKLTFDHLAKLVQTSDAGKAGVHYVSGYNLLKGKEPDPTWKDAVVGFRHATEAELQRQFPVYTYGWFFTTLLCEIHRYIPFMTERFLKNGGNVIQRRIGSFAELGGQYDVVVNCTGIASRFLANDDSLHPVRGQLMRIKAPFLKHWCLTNLGDPSMTFIFPWQDDVIVGGTAQQGRWDTDIDPKDAKEVWERACFLMPSLKNAKIVKHWAGLRPQRTKGIRVESETMTFGSQKVKVVHNYGHGGSGISLHWGCAGDAAKLVQKELLSVPAAKL